MNVSQLLSIVNPALQTFFEYDHYLLEYDVSELAITHKLATYMERQLQEQMELWNADTPRYVIDCEFNRESDAVKRLPLSHFLSERREQLYAPCPDIIIHERGTDDHNAVVIEVKKRNRRFNDFLRALDLLKLACFAEHPLRYDNRLFLMFDAGNAQCKLLEACLIVDATKLDEESYRELQKNLRKAWAQIRKTGGSRAPDEVRRPAIELANSLLLQDILDKSCKRLTLPTSE